MYIFCVYKIHTSSDLKVFDLSTNIGHGTSCLVRNDRGVLGEHGRRPVIGQKIIPLIKEVTIWLPVKTDKKYVILDKTKTNKSGKNKVF